MIVSTLKVSNNYILLKMEYIKVAILTPIIRYLYGSGDVKTQRDSF